MMKIAAIASLTSGSAHPQADTPYLMRAYCGHPKIRMKKVHRNPRGRSGLQVGLDAVIAEQEDRNGLAEA